MFGPEIYMSASMNPTKLYFRCAIELNILEIHEPSAYSQMLMVEVEQDLVSTFILLLDLVVREVTTA